MEVRTSDVNFQAEVQTWYDQLFGRVQKHLHGRGGHILMVQVEHDYGAFPACDKAYLNWLRDETLKHVKGDALLFTADMPSKEALSCGSIDGAFITTYFGMGKGDLSLELS